MQLGEEMITKKVIITPKECRTIEAVIDKMFNSMKEMLIKSWNKGRNSLRTRLYATKFTIYQRRRCSKFPVSIKRQHIEAAKAVQSLLEDTN